MSWRSVMDMVIFRTIFFEPFSFLHVHAPYLPFRLLTNLGMHQRQDETLLFIQPMTMVHKDKHIIVHWGTSTVESDSSSIASSATGARVGTITEDITPASSSTTSSRTGNSSRWDGLALGRARTLLYLHPLEIPPTDLKEIRWAIGSSSHIAQLAKKNRGAGHAPANVM